MAGFWSASTLPPEHAAHTAEPTPAYVFLAHAWQAVDEFLSTSAVPAAHGVHVRAAVEDATLMVFPAVHVVWAVQEVLRCEAAAWNVLDGHAEQERRAVLESALSLWPLPQLGCAEQDVARWLELVWYSLAPQSEHVRFDFVLSALVFCPLPQVGCAEQDVARWLELVWY